MILLLPDVVWTVGSSVTGYDAVVGYVCLRLLRYIARSGHFAVFAFYCWAVGILVLVFTLVT